MELQGDSRSRRLKKSPGRRLSSSDSGDSDNDSRQDSDSGFPPSPEKSRLPSSGKKPPSRPRKASPQGFRRTRPGSVSGAPKRGLCAARDGGADSPGVVGERTRSGKGKPLKSVTSKWLRDLEGDSDTSRRQSKRRQFIRTWMKDIEAMASAGSQPSSVSPRPRPGATVTITQKDIARLFEMSPARSRVAGGNRKAVKKSCPPERTSELDCGEADSSNFDIDRLLEYDNPGTRHRKSEGAPEKRSRVSRTHRLSGAGRETRKGATRDESDSGRTSRSAKTKLDRLREDISRLERLVDVTGEKLGNLESPFTLPTEIAVSPSPLSCLEERGDDEESPSLQFSKKSWRSSGKCDPLLEETTLEKDKSTAATETSGILRSRRKESFSRRPGQTSRVTGLNREECEGAPVARQRSLSRDTLTLQNIAAACRKGKQGNDVLRAQGRSPLRAEFHRGTESFTQGRGSLELSTSSTSCGVKSESDSIQASSFNRIDGELSPSSAQGEGVF